ncbi:hypothetical protein Dimus_006390 [Dionaea muscipula]
MKEVIDAGPVLLEEHRRQLSAPFSVSDVKRALCDIDVDKAPGGWMVSHHGFFSKPGILLGMTCVKQFLIFSVMEVQKYVEKALGLRSTAHASASSGLIDIWCLLLRSSSQSFLFSDRFCRLGSDGLERLL